MSMVACAGGVAALDAANAGAAAAIGGTPAISKVKKRPRPTKTLVTFFPQDASDGQGK